MKCTSVSPMPLRILIDATSLRARSGLRGIGRYTHDLLLGLASVAQRDRVILEAVTHFAPFRASADLRAVAEESIAERGTFSDAIFQQRRLHLANAVRATGADLLHMPQAYGMPWGRVPRLVVTCHDLIPLVYPQAYLGVVVGGRRFGGRWAGKVLRWGKELLRYRRADHVICISERTQVDLLRYCHLNPVRVSVVPNGVLLARYETVTTSTPPARPYVLYVGYCDARKDIPTLFKALSMVNRADHVDLQWVGDLDAAQRDAMQRLAAECGVSEKVQFLGFVEDAALTRLYQHATALVFLSRLEGFGLPVLEAMAAGCPVIVARGSASDEVCGAAGILVDAGDAEGAAAAISLLISNPAGAKLKIAAGMIRAREFSCERMAEETLRAYGLAVERGL